LQPRSDYKVRPYNGVISMKFAVMIFVLTAIAMAEGCGGSASAPTAPQGAAVTASSPAADVVPRDARGIQTMRVEMAEVPEYLALPAHIEADPTRLVHVFPPAGGRIVEMKVRPWDRVEKGNALAVLESSELSRAAADYQKARVDNEVKQKALTRAEDLLAHHAIAEKDFQQAQGDAQMAQAEQNTSRDRIRVLGADPDHATNQLIVAAPRSGVILDIGAATGEFSRSLDAPQPLCTIADISSIWAVGEIYEKDLVGVKSGQRAEVSINAYSEKRWPGHISVISDAVDPTTRTLRVRVVLANSDGRLKPAMFGSVRILRSSSKGILVPSTAVLREGAESYVFAGKGTDRFERRGVTLGRAVDGSLEILKGLSPGDTIVSDGALLLRAAAKE
jgi:cobalt-zinc-cadmium efflux system membrane fusion protein